ncbi:hypothetical protein SGP3_0007 (plasmid) [Sodalis glossinidius str. 'morsitans']|uniref:Uncharacterized protein n=1 Tax=Sodalis glossinidius (strain morsitans) TaxID=343509 RepID=Q2NPY4_SODGM|nr:hypothetical protein SGP3_0007 [Sodalis glossinidius str. 'morsitans']
MIHFCVTTDPKLTQCANLSATTCGKISIEDNENPTQQMSISTCIIYASHHKHLAIPKVGLAANWLGFRLTYRRAEAPVRLCKLFSRLVCLRHKPPKTEVCGSFLLRQSGLDFNW